MEDECSYAILVLYYSFLLNFGLDTFISAYLERIFYRLELCSCIFTSVSGSLGFPSHWFIIGLHNGTNRNPALLCSCMFHVHDQMIRTLRTQVLSTFYMFQTKVNSVKYLFSPVFKTWKQNKTDHSKVIKSENLFFIQQGKKKKKC